MTLTYEQVTKRNKRHRDPRTRATDRALARAARAHGGLHREPHQEIEINAWHQPGRTYGPSPLGPDHPKANKVTDSDGNARILPLTADQRIARYMKVNHFRCPARPRDDADESDYDARRHAELLGVTMRQLRRIVHKANHASAPFGKRVSV